jgi:magnesium chelatase family protein
MFGGGDAVDGPRPGLLSLAHKGILLADEFFEWPRATAEALRTPLQDKQVVISRRDWQVTWPADFMLIATANPCPCGYSGHPVTPCRCTPAQRQRYLAKISGPVFDRIDLRVWVPPANVLGNEDRSGESSQEIAARVAQAVSEQHKRYEGVGITRNAELGPGMHEAFCLESRAALVSLQVQQEAGLLSARGLNKLRGVARTVADLEGCETVDVRHVDAALELARWKPEGSEAA